MQHSRPGGPSNTPALSMLLELFFCVHSHASSIALTATFTMNNAIKLAQAQELTI